MLFVLFQINQDRYALPACRIVEVLPLLRLKVILQTPPGISGLFNYRGTLVPVIDLNIVTVGTAAERRLSTRIILVEYAFNAQCRRILGLVAEHVTETIQLSSEAFAETGVTSEGAPFLGRVAEDTHGFIQWVEVERLLTAAHS
jgi:chemotaxis-related protein WspB